MKEVVGLRPNKQKPQVEPAAHYHFTMNGDEGRKPLDERAHNLIMNEFYKTADHVVNSLVRFIDTCG